MQRCVLFIFAVKFYEFLETEKNIFRKGIFYPFKQGIAFYASLNNSRYIHTCIYIFLKICVRNRCFQGRRKRVLKSEYRLSVQFRSVISLDLPILSEFSVQSIVWFGFSMQSPYIRANNPFTCLSIRWSPKQRQWQGRTFKNLKPPCMQLKLWLEKITSSRSAKNVISNNIRGKVSSSSRYPIILSVHTFDPGLKKTWV